MGRQLPFFIAAIVFSGAATLWAASSEPVTQPRCTATLVSETDAVAAGEPFTVGLLLEADEHWHTYWRNPGESGLATSIAWDLPEGFEAGPIQWPTPKKFVTAGPIINFGYEGPVLLLVQITPPPAPEVLQSDEVTITAEARWLVCDPNQCLPGSASLTLQLPVTQSEPTKDDAVAEAFAAARRAMPQPIDPQRVHVESVVNDQLTFSVQLDEPPGDASALVFLPTDGDAFEPDARIDTPGDGRVRVTLTIFNPRHPPQRLRGVLKLPDRACRIDVPVASD